MKDAEREKELGMLCADNRGFLWDSYVNTVCSLLCMLVPQAARKRCI